VCSRWTHESGWDDIVWPMAVRGLAMGLLFVPMSTSALRSLPPADVAQGSGLFNLFRHIGASVCIAVLATLLGQWRDVHRVEIAERVGALDRPVQERVDLLESMMAARGVPVEEASPTVTRLVDRGLEAQAWMLSFQDAYALLMLIALVYFPLVPLLRRAYTQQA
jgi:DHA2 family multidrug resistance protein